MRYWITTQSPPERREVMSTEVDYIWVPDKRHEHAFNLKPGDLVVVYQGKTGPIRVDLDSDNNVLKKYYRHYGVGGVVALVEIVGPLENNRETEPEYYSKNKSKPILWCWRAPSKTINSKGYLSRQDLSKAIGYKTTHKYQGFGTKKSGLMEITAEKFHRIRNGFIQNSPPEKKPNPASGHPGGLGGGEGNAHKHLKCAVVHFPVEVLGKPGLLSGESEVGFTGLHDRVDVKLKDENGKLIAVEIEVHVDSTQIEGLLQSIKYKYMLAVQHERGFDEVDAYFVAYSIDDRIKELCDRYDVQYFEVSEEMVKKYYRSDLPCK